MSDNNSCNNNINMYVRITNFFSIIIIILSFIRLENYLFPTHIASIEQATTSLLFFWILNIQQHNIYIITNNSSASIIVRAPGPDWEQD